MRIIGGTAGRTSLKAPKGMAVRPTPDRVRQAVFNSLGERVVGATVLELFAGTGALSLECLSRGAVHAVCVELSRKHAEFIRANAAQAGLSAQALELRIQDAFAAIKQLAALGKSFGLIFADPPYGEKNLGRRSTSLAQRLLDDPSLPLLLAEGGLFILGHASRDAVTVPDTLWRETKTMRHGDNAMRFLVRPAP
jgi:16S rRNA (guanine966-N2)-methyltransferase